MTSPQDDDLERPRPWWVPKWLDRKHLLLVTLISLSILFNIALFSQRVISSSSESILGQIPFLFWAMLPICSVLVMITVQVWKDWRVSVAMASLYFLMFYSFTLFFKIIPNQTDIGASSFYMWYFESDTYLDMNKDAYFEFPIYFVFANLLKRSLGLDPFQTINLGFFLVIGAYPMALSSMIHKGLSKNLAVITFLFPVIYLISIFFYFNDQFVPQFIGLFFLIATVGSYTQLVTTKDVRFFYLTMVLYTVCVFSHYFMWVFFILGMIFHKLYVIATRDTGIKGISISFEGSVKDMLGRYMILSPRKIMKLLDRAWSKVMAILAKYYGRTEKKDLSLIVLLIIFLIGYLWRFDSIGYHIRRTFETNEGRGGSWILVSYILGSRSAAGISQIVISPHYDLISQTSYLLSRYSIFLVLFLIMIALGSAILKARKERILPLDVHFLFGSIVFLFTGFFNPNILGERATQAIFLTTSKYHTYKTTLFKRSLPILAIVIVISPVLFTLNFTINETIDGNMFIEDESSVQPGSFINEKRPENITILTTDRRFYPTPLPLAYNATGYRSMTPYTLLLQSEYTIEDADIILANPKFINRMEFFSLDGELKILNNSSKIFDQGDGYIYLVL